MRQGLALLLVFALAGGAQASVCGFCRDVLSSTRQTWTNSKNFLKKTTDRKGLNILFTPSPAKDEEESGHDTGSRLKGLIRLHPDAGDGGYFSEGLLQVPVMALSGWISGVPASLHPFGALRNSVFIPITEYLSQKWTGKKYRPSEFLFFLGGLAGYSIAIAESYAGLDRLTKTREIKTARRFSPELLDFALYDFRARQFFPGLTEKDFDNNDSVIHAVYLLRRAADDYYQERMRYQAPDTRELRQHFQNHLMLLPVRGFFDQILRPMSGFYVPEDKLITDDEKDAVFLSEDLLLTDDELAYLLLGLSPMTPVARDFVRTRAATFRLQALEKSEALKRIATASADRGLTSKRALYWLQSYLYWMHTMDIWKTLGIAKYKMIEQDGKPVLTTEILTLDDVQKEILEAIAGS
jgi:hypothetical protein